MTFLTPVSLVDRIVVTVCVVILVEFDKYQLYYQKQTQIPTDGETSRLVYPLTLTSFISESS